MERSSTLRSNARAAAWAHPEDIILHGVSQSLQDKYYVTANRQGTEPESQGIGGRTQVLPGAGAGGQNGEWLCDGLSLGAR